MSDAPNQPRLWRTLGLGAAALGFAAAPAAALTPAGAPTDGLLWHAQAEGGEEGEAGEAGTENGEEGGSEGGEDGESSGATDEAGESGEAAEAGESGETGEAGAGEAGESGLVSEDDPDAAFATRLALVDAHLRAALEAETAGLSREATELATHPERELMEDLRGDLASRGGTDFSDQIDAFVETVGSGTSETDRQAAYGAVAAPLNEAFDGLPAKARFEALHALVLAAADEQEDGEGEAAPIEVRGFLATARAIADRLAQDADATVAEAGSEAASALSDAEGALAATPDDTTILRAAAAQVELAMLQIP